MDPDLVFIGSLSGALLYTGWQSMLCCRHGDLGSFLLGTSMVLFMFVPYMVYALIVDQVEINGAGPYFVGSGVCRFLTLYLTAQIYRRGELSLTQAMEGLTALAVCVIVGTASHMYSLGPVDIIGIAFLALGMLIVTLSLGVTPNKHHAADEIEMNSSFSPMGSPRKNNGVDPAIDTSEPSFESNPFAKIKRMADRKKGKRPLIIMKASRYCTILRWQGAGWTLLPSIFFALNLHLDCVGVQYWEPVAFSLSSSSVALVLTWCAGSIWRSNEITNAWTVSWVESKTNILVTGFLFVLAHTLLLVSMKEIDMNSYSSATAIYLGAITLVSLLFGWWYCEEPWNKAKTVGAVCSVVGVLAMVVAVFYT